MSAVRSSIGPVSARSVLLVARRELLARLRSRVFALSTVALAILVAGGVVAASYLSAGTAGRAGAVRVGFSGGSRDLAPAFSSVAAALGQTVAVTDVADAATGTAMVQAGTLDMAVGGSATEPAAVAGESLPSMAEIALDAAVQEARLSASGLSPAAVASVMAAVPVQRVHPAGSPGPGSDQSVYAGLVVAILLFISISVYGNLVAQGVVEEKATRIIEILLATVRPAELLAGKISGIGLAGLLQLGIVAAAALAAAEVTHGLSIPALGVPEVVSYLAWFLLGFALYASAYAAVAALVSRHEEVQSATAPVTIVLSISYVAMFFALPEPAGPLGTALSLVPPSAPIFMPMRIAAGAAVPWQVGLSMALTAVAIAGVVWLAGRVYANSAMRAGRRLGFMEALRGQASRA